MSSSRPIPTPFTDVRIVDGRLQIHEGVRCLLKGLLAPTDCPRAQLRHLQWTVALLSEAGTLVAEPDRLMLLTARQLAAAIEVALSYEDFLTASGGPVPRAAGFERVRPAPRHAA